MSNAAPTPAEDAPPPGKLAALVILAIVIVLIVAWVVIATQFIADTSLVGGFLLLWYWATVEKLETARLPAAMIGAVVGIALAWFLVWGAANYGAVGLGGALALLLLVLYLDILKAFPLAINAATTLFLTLAAAPLVQLHVNWGELVLSTVAGGLFFGGVAEGLKRLAGRFAAAS
jgi:hypothetical protein